MEYFKDKRPVAGDIGYRAVFLREARHPASKRKFISVLGNIYSMRLEADIEASKTKKLNVFEKKIMIVTGVFKDFRDIKNKFIKTSEEVF